MVSPARGEIWLVDLDPTRGHEQAGKRPCLVVSVDAFNQGSAGLVVVAPLTSKAKAQRFHVPITPPEAGLRVQSYIKCEDIRSVSIHRFSQHWGFVTPATIHLVEDRFRILLGL
ncbi:MAG: type II toxin-antitoxin system PemK/MazF family toxin [Ktedonobacterales bacterium]